MKKINQKLLASALAASALAVSAFAPVAHAEVSASVGAANMYYWRGFDLGSGDAAIWGDINVSGNGFYGGVWTSSGDILNGTEWDFYAGYGTEIGGFGIDVSYWSYVYPERNVAVGDLAEIVLGLSYGPVALTYYDNQEGADGYSYFTLGATFDSVSLKYGQHSEDVPGAYDSYAHFDITYAYNDNLSFTLGNPVDNEVENSVLAGGGTLTYPEDPKVIVNFTIPIE